MPLTLLQCMRLHTDFEDFTLIGNQYKDERGVREWHLAIWSERDNKVRTCWVVAGQQPEQLSGEYLSAVEAAISAWEGEPVWVH